jgi:hypothetical protein
VLLKDLILALIVPDLPDIQSVINTAFSEGIALSLAILIFYADE